jgi:hypothetical protein
MTSRPRDLAVAEQFCNATLLSANRLSFHFLWHPTPQVHPASIAIRQPAFGLRVIRSEQMGELYTDCDFGLMPLRQTTHISAPRLPLDRMLR